MAKFRKKPVVIEAVQFMGAPAQGSHYPGSTPVGVPDGVCLDSHDYPNWVEGPHVHTLEGPLRAMPGDWIITGVKGEQYPCKPDIFAATYEAVEDGGESKEK